MRKERGSGRWVRAERTRVAGRRPSRLVICAGQWLARSAGRTRQGVHSARIPVRFLGKPFQGLGRRTRLRSRADRCGNLQGAGEREVSRRGHGVRALGQSRGRGTTKIPAAVDAPGLPIRFELTARHRSDIPQAKGLIARRIGDRCAASPVSRLPRRKSRATGDAPKPGPSTGALRKTPPRRVLLQTDQALPQHRPARGKFPRDLPGLCRAPLRDGRAHPDENASRGRSKFGRGAWHWSRGSVDGRSGRRGSGGCLSGRPWRGPGRGGTTLRGSSHRMLTAPAGAEPRVRARPPGPHLHRGSTAGECSMPSPACPDPPCFGQPARLPPAFARASGRAGALAHLPGCLCPFGRRGFFRTVASVRRSRAHPGQPGVLVCRGTSAVSGPSDLPGAWTRPTGRPDLWFAYAPVWSPQRVRPLPVDGPTGRRISAGRIPCRVAAGAPA